MAKRFTDTEKWKHPTFRSLNLKARLAWIFLLDECDHAGMWLLDFEVASAKLGFTVDLAAFTEWFGEKLFLAGDKRLFIPDFLRFQYGVKKHEEFNPSSKPHLAVLRELENHGVSLDHPGESLSRLIGVDRVSKELPKGSETLQDKDKDKDKDKDTRPILSRAASFDFNALYAKYPRKEGKPAGLIQCRKQIKTQADYDALSRAIDRYAAQRAKDGVELKMFSTFLGSERTGHPWREWCDPETGSTTVGQSRAPNWDFVFGEGKDAG